MVLQTTKRTNQKLLSAFRTAVNKQEINGITFHELIDEKATAELCKTLGLNVDDNYYEFDNFKLWFNWVNQHWYIG